jgi:predicted TIM-barrel fold metal-dependent hydrolase
VIIDAQIHVWKAETPERPWFSGPPHLPEPFGYENLRREMATAGVNRAVLIPPGWEGDRIDFALEGAQRHPGLFGVMGRIPVQKPDVAAPLLPGWKAQRGMLGIRVSFQKAHNQLYLTDGTADWFWPEAEKHGIPVMIFAPGRNAEIRAIAESHPNLRLIVDHMGLRREEDAAAAAAIEGLCALADCPNMHVKVSSVPLYSTEPYPHRNLHGALKRLIGAFGPRRSFWGTDLTRIWSRTTYRRCVTLFTEELDFLSPDDLAWVMGRGIAECLEWPIPEMAR